jgi:ethanolamine utilization cobalamin adenosyltransferase
MYDIELCSEKLNEIAAKKGFTVILEVRMEELHYYSHVPRKHPVLYATIQEGGADRITFRTVEDADRMGSEGKPRPQSSQVPWHRFHHLVQNYIEASPVVRQLLETRNALTLVHEKLRRKVKELEDKAARAIEERDAAKTLLEQSQV